MIPDTRPRLRAHDPDEQREQHEPRDGVGSAAGANSTSSQPRNVVRSVGPRGVEADEREQQPGNAEQDGEPRAARLDRKTAGGRQSAQPAMRSGRRQR